MKINEVVKKTGLTKKAIRFYEQEGLITPSIDAENGYRNYNNADIKKLIEITLYRQLDMSIKDIKLAFQEPCNLHKLLEEHKACLEANIKKLERNKIILNSILDDRDNNTQEVTKKLKLLSDSIALDDKEKANYIKEELLRIFPGTYGKMLKFCLSPFLNIKIDTEEKEQAWLEIIKFLDEINIDYPQGFEDIFNDIPNNFPDENIEKFTDEMNNILNMSNVDKEAYIKKVLDIAEKLSNDENFKASYKEKYNIGEGLKQSLLKSGFYDIFVNNFIIISEDYKKYHDLLNEIQNQLKSKNNEKLDILSF